MPKYEVEFPLDETVKLHEEVSEEYTFCQKVITDTDQQSIEFTLIRDGVLYNATIPMGMLANKHEGKSVDFSNINIPSYGTNGVRFGDYHVQMPAVEFLLA